MQILLLTIVCGAQVSSKAGPITVSELLAHVSVQSGVQLAAEGVIGRTLVVTSFEAVSVESFKRALATVVDGDWKGGTLAMPESVTREYWARIKEGQPRNEEDLRAFIRCVRGEMLAEDLPEVFAKTIEKLKTHCAPVLTELVSWSDQEIEWALKGDVFWIVVSGNVRFIASYSTDSGSLIISDLQAATRESAIQSFVVGKPVIADSRAIDDPGWHRTGEWRPLNQLRWEHGGGQFSSGVNAADRVGSTVQKPSIAVFARSPFIASVQGYSAYLEEDGWILLRPYTYDRPGLHAVAPDVMTSDRLESPEAAIDALGRLRSAMPYYYQELWSDPPTWYPLTASNSGFPLSSLWQALDRDEKEKLLNRRLYYSDLTAEAQSAWRRGVPAFLVSANLREQDVNAIHVTPHDLLAANVRLRGKTRVSYRHVEGGSGYETVWEGLGRGQAFRVTDDTVFQLFDVAEVWCTVVLPSGKSFSRRTEIRWYLGPAAYGELVALEPSRHPELALSNKKR